jgi:hypothetical protein
MNINVGVKRLLLLQVLEQAAAAPSGISSISAAPCSTATIP